MTPGCHADDVRDNNRLTNLSWGTHADNYEDRVRNGGGNHGERHGMAKLSDNDVMKARSLYRAKEATFAELAKYFDISECSITDAVRGKTFAHLNDAVAKEAKTHCRNGHELSGDNLLPRKNRLGRCRICDTASKRKYKAKMREINQRLPVPN